MTDTQDVFGYMEPIPRYYGCTGVLATVAFFKIVNQTVTEAGPPKNLKVDYWRYKNLLISWVHAVITGAWSVLCMLVYPEMFEDLISHHSLLAYSLVAFSTGYFLYDFGDIFVHKRVMKQWEVVVHHVIIFSMFFGNLMECRYIAYTSFTLIAEINSIFLHSRKLMQITGVPFSSYVYKVNCIVNLATFLVFRFISLGIILYGMYMWRERTATWFYTCLIFSMIAMVPINFGLLGRLVYSDVIRAWSKSSNRSEESAHHHNGVVNDDFVSSNRNINKVANGHVQFPLSTPSPSSNNVLSHKNGSVYNGYGHNDNIHHNSATNGTSQHGISCLINSHKTEQHFTNGHERTT